MDNYKEREVPSEVLCPDTHHFLNDFIEIFSSSSCAIPETGVGASPHIPVLSVCF